MHATLNIHRSWHHGQHSELGTTNTPTQTQTQIQTRAHEDKDKYNHTDKYTETDRNISKSKYTYTQTQPYHMMIAQVYVSVCSHDELKVQPTTDFA